MFDVGKMVDAVLDAVDKPMRAMHERLKAVEARPPDERLPEVQPDLAEQLKAAVRMLEEPPLFERPVVRHLAGTMITRGGELAVSYSDGTSERLGAVIGPPGESGPPGRDGAAGAIGARGDEGPRGRDGISITAAAINRDGELMLTLSDGTVLTPGCIVK